MWKGGGTVVRAVWGEEGPGSGTKLMRRKEQMPEDDGEGGVERLMG